VLQSHAQVLSILSSKLASLPWPVFQSQALELAARKVSSSTGDLRKVFQVCDVLEFSSYDIADKLTFFILTHTYTHTHAHTHTHTHTHAYAHAHAQAQALSLTKALIHVQCALTTLTYPMHLQACRFALVNLHERILNDQAEAANGLPGSESNQQQQLVGGPLLSVVL